LWWLKALAFMKRDFLLMASYRFSLALQLLGILFSIATFFYIARIFGPSAAPLLAEYGGDYFAFVLIGMAFSGYLAAALSSFSSGIREGQLTGTLEAMLVTPARLPEILVCSGLWSFVVTSFRVIMYLILGAAVFGVSFTRLNLSAALSILILTILSFAALGVMSASFVVLFKKGDPFALAIGSASALLGGVYFPVGVLPAWLQRISVFLPITYSLRAIRLALLQGYGVSALIREIAALSMFAAVLCPTSAWLFRMAVRRSKRTGGLGQY
jgi:ABC-2 type transport system permease protein